MGQVDADRNLLFGVLALQMDFISREQLIAATSAWVVAKQRPLAELLVQQGALSRERQGLLDALVHEHLQAHGGDAQQSLAAMRPVTGLTRELAEIPDSDLQASLVHVGGSSSNEPMTRAVTNVSLLGMPSGPATPSGPGTEVGEAYATQPGPTNGRTEAATRYRILRLHASGGLGQVYVAHDSELKREVALKEIQDRHADSPQNRARFLLEAEITGNLEHPGIVPVYGLGHYPDGRPYYAMRFIKGDSLRDAIERYHRPKGTRPPAGQRQVEFRQLLRRFLDVCNAMAYAHSRGVLHRDLKPGNIMLGQYGETLVVDWGLAKPLGTAEAGTAGQPALGTSDEWGSGSAPTVAGAAIGTPQYMSPEQAVGDLDRLGPASDVYSLGATLYCLLTGNSAFEHADVESMLDHVRRGDFPRPRQIIPTVPPPLEAICLKAMALRPEDRYASPSALAQDVEHWLADEAVSAWREPRHVRWGRWARRHRLVVAAVAGLVVAIIPLLLVSNLMIRRQKEKTEVQRTQALRNYVEAERQRKHANELRSEAELQRAEAHTQRDRATLMLADMYTRSGFEADREDHPEQAVLWFAHAVCVGTLDPLREQANRARIRTWGRKVPEPIDAWPISYLGGHASAAFHPSGRWLLVQGYQRGCLMFEPGSPRPLPWAAGDRRVVCSRFSPDGQWLALGLPGGQVELRTVPAGQIAHRVEHEGPITALAFSPDGRYLALAGQGAGVRVWDTRAARFATPTLPHPQPVWALVFSPDGDTLATASDDERVRVYHVSANRSEADEPALLFDALVNVSTGGWTAPPVFVAGGRTLVTITEARLATWWDAATGEPLRTSALNMSAVTSMAASRDGKVLAIGGHHGAHLFNALTGAPIGPFRAHRNWVAALDFSPDDQTLLTASEDRTVRLWPVNASGSAAREIGHLASVQQAVFAPDGEHVATVQGDGLVRLWRLPAPDPRDRWPGIRGVGEETNARISNDGRLTMAVHPFDDPNQPDHTHVYAVATGRPACPQLNLAGVLHDGAFAPDGREAAVTSANEPDGDKPPATPGQLEFFDTSTGARLGPAIALPSRPRSVAYRPDGRQLAVLCSGGDIVLIDPAQRRIEKAWHEALLPEKYRVLTATIVYTPDGRTLAAVGPDQAVRIWDAQAGKLRFPTIPTPAANWRASLSPDGRLLAVGSGEDNSLRIWDLQTGKLSVEPLRHPDWVFQGSFSPDGRYLATACRDHLVRVWDWRAGTVARPPLKHPDEVYAAVFTRDGRWLLTAGRDGAFRAWEWQQSSQPVMPTLRFSPTSAPSDVLSTPDSAHAIITGRGHSNVNILSLADLSATSDLSVDDLLLRGELLSGFALEHGDLNGLTTDEWLKRWRVFHAKHPQPAPLSPEESEARHVPHLRLFLADHRWAEAIQALDTLLAAQPDRDDWLVSRANVHAELGHWAQADADLARAIRLGQHPLRAQTLRATLALAQGDRQAFRAQCAALVAQYGKATDQLTANNVASLCVLAPDSLDNFEPCLTLARRAAAKSAPYVVQNTLGTALERAGRHEEAVAALNAAVQAHGKGGTPFDWLFLALAHHRLGHKQEAQQFLERSQDWLDRAARGELGDSGLLYSWDERVQLRGMRQEVETELAR